MGFGAAAFTRFAGEGWWARQPPYEAAFHEGFRGLIKTSIRRVPTKLPRGRRSVCRPYAQSSAALRSNYQASLMAISRENILEVDPGTTLVPASEAWDSTRSNCRVPTMPASSITSTSRVESRSRPWFQPCSKLAMVRDAMPDPLSRFSAAMPDSATPRTS